MFSKILTLSKIDKNVKKNNFYCGNITNNMDSFPAEIFCEITCHIDISTWKSWIRVCKIFLRMLPMQCEPKDLLGLFIVKSDIKFDWSLLSQNPGTKQETTVLNSEQKHAVQPPSEHTRKQEIRRVESIYRLQPNRRDKFILSGRITFDHVLSNGYIEPITPENLLFNVMNFH